jgi:hypothetical protein
MAAASFGALGGHAEEISNHTVKASSNEGPLDKPLSKPRNRGRLSQRQVRKDRRRAHAAGSKKAFA